MAYLQWLFGVGNACLPGGERPLRACSEVKEIEGYDQVERYIAGQVGKERFSERFETLMREFTVRCPEVDLSQPTETSHGRYWYNLHVVLVVGESGAIHDRGCLARIRDGCFRIAMKKGHRIAILSVMPTHVHMALRGSVNDMPEEIALGFQNNLAYLLGQTPIWREGFYVGTFSEYDMGAIRVRGERGKPPIM